MRIAPGDDMAGNTGSSAAAALIDGVSITLIQDDNGWGFCRWTLTDSRPIAVRPTDAHRALRFWTVPEALRFFRVMYGDQLRASQ